MQIARMFPIPSTPLLSWVCGMKTLPWLIYPFEVDLRIPLDQCCHHRGPIFTILTGSRNCDLIGIPGGGLANSWMIWGGNYQNFDIFFCLWIKHFQHRVLVLKISWFQRLVLTTFQTPPPGFSSYLRKPYFHFIQNEKRKYPGAFYIKKYNVFLT